MACRGVHFALTADEEKKLLAAKGDDAVMDVIQEEIEERWDEQWLAETDKAWDAIHRCLTDGTLNLGDTPFHKCVFGGRPLYEGDDYFVSYVTAAEVREISEAITPIDQNTWRARFFKLDPEACDFELSEDEFDYTWAYFADLAALYAKATRANRAMVFTVDQ